MQTNHNNNMKNAHKFTGFDEIFMQINQISLFQWMSLRVTYVISDWIDPFFFLTSFLQFLSLDDSIIRKTLCNCSCFVRICFNSLLVPWNWSTYCRQYKLILMSFSIVKNTKNKKTNSIPFTVHQIRCIHTHCILQLFFNFFSSSTRLTFGILSHNFYHCFFVQHRI